MPGKKTVYRRITERTRRAGDRLRARLDAGRKPVRPAGRPGRPQLYRHQFCEIATRHCMLGATNEELGALFGVTKETVQEWMRTRKEFKEAIYKGREGADAEVASALFARARGMTIPDDVVHYDTDRGKFKVLKAKKHLPPDPGAAKFILANRRAVKERVEGNAWRDRVEHTGEGGGPVDLTVSFIKSAAVPAQKEKA